MDDRIFRKMFIAYTILLLKIHLNVTDISVGEMSEHEIGKGKHIL